MLWTLTRAFSECRCHHFIPQGVEEEEGRYRGYSLFQSKTRKRFQNSQNIEHVNKTFSTPRHQSGFGPPLIFLKS
jgi:hypothetical protein